jgi:hypothetical protein
MRCQSEKAFCKLVALKESQYLTPYLLRVYRFSVQFKQKNQYQMILVLSIQRVKLASSSS